MSTAEGYLTTVFITFDDSGVVREASVTGGARLSKKESEHAAYKIIYDSDTKCDNV